MCTINAESKCTIQCETNTEIAHFEACIPSVSNQGQANQILRMLTLKQNIITEFYKNGNISLLKMKKRWAQIKLEIQTKL